MVVCVIDASHILFIHIYAYISIWSKVSRNENFLNDNMAKKYFKKDIFQIFKSCMSMSCEWEMGHRGPTHPTNDNIEWLMFNINYLLVLSIYWIGFQMIMFIACYYYEDWIYTRFETIHNIFFTLCKFV